MDACGGGEFPTAEQARTTGGFVSGRVQPACFHIPSQLMDQLR